MNELTKRILFAVPAASLFIWLAWLGGLPFNLTMALIAGIVIWEVHRLMTNASFPDIVFISYLIAGIIWVNKALPVWITGLAGACIVILTILAVFTYYSNLSRKWISTLFVAFYAPLGLYMTVYIRNLGGSTDGFWLILGLFLMIWGNDVFAYFGGKNFGRNKMAPQISPGKTWEGFAFGIAGAITGALIVWSLAQPFPLSLAEIIPAALIVSITGPVGDLTESRIKRLAGAKDSSSLLPGHGGLFDRFDAMILTAPVLYFYFSFFI